MPTGFIGFLIIAVLLFVAVGAVPGLVGSLGPLPLLLVFVTAALFLVPSLRRLAISLVVVGLLASLAYSTVNTQYQEAKKKDFSSGVPYVIEAIHDTLFGPGAASQVGSRVASQVGFGESVLPENCEQPSVQWDFNREPSGLHGPYASIEVAMRQDAAGSIAYQYTGPVIKFIGTGNAEYGFVIVRDRRQKTKYYTTPPVLSSVKPTATQRPVVLWSDFVTSFDKAFTGSCESIDNFTIQATVHTHPMPEYWGWAPFVDNFSMDDFNQAIQLKQLPLAQAASDGDKRELASLKKLVPEFEKIVMINERDRYVRTFTPTMTDLPFTDDEKTSYAEQVTSNPRWQEYAGPSRVKAIAQYRLP